MNVKQNTVTKCNMIDSITIIISDRQSDQISFYTKNNREK